MTEPSPSPPTQPLCAWDLDALRATLAPLLPGIGIDVVERIASTNTALLERARVGPDRREEREDGDAGVRVRRSVESAAFGRRSIDLQPSLLVALHQTGGRGRQGRQWRSAPGASLTFSLALPLATADWSGLSLAVGVALCEALEPASAGGVPRLGLKWPNDLWLMDGALAEAPAGRKLGGILIETVATGHAPRLVVVGVGLNVRPFDAVEPLAGPANLQELDPAASPQSVLAAIARPLAQALRQFEREGFAAFADRVAARDLLRDRPVQTTQADAREGIARGVTAQGALRVDTPGGGIVAVASGEVSVRFNGGHSL